MSLVKRTFEVPLKDKLLDPNGFVSQPWMWFFRSLSDSLFSLGEESSFELLNDLNAKTFASADVNTTTDVITETAHGYYTGLVGQLTTSVTLPTGLSLATDYYIIKVNANSYKFATSKANADSGTAINITGAGTGNHTFTPRGDITDLKFNLRGVSQATVDFLIQRVTTSGGATELIESGMFVVSYNPTSADWSLTMIGTPGPDDSGIDFSIDSNGQVQYVSTSITGTASISKITWRSRTLGAKNSLYSSVGAK